MRIVFIGTSEFAVPSLRALVDAGHDVPLVVTQPDRPGHRLRMTPPAVKTAARELGLEILQPAKIRESADALSAARPELIVLVAYGQIIPRAILEIAPRGVLNLHASLLPRHRGAAPVARALLAGDRVTGVTIMQMDEELDHGPVLAKREVVIDERDDAASLTARLAAVGAELLVETVARLDEIQPEPQRHREATYAPKLSRTDGELAWEMSAEDIDRRVRAFTPWPGATLPWGSERVKVLRGHVAAERDSSLRAPGEVLRESRLGVAVATGSGAYVLEEVQLPGRRPMAARVLTASGA